MSSLNPPNEPRELIHSTTEQEQQVADHAASETEEVYEKPRLWPQDEEREGDFWCD